jgi:hypothetical protein
MAVLLLFSIQKDKAVEQKQDTVRQSPGIEEKNRYFINSSDLEIDRNNLYPRCKEPVPFRGATVTICAYAGVVRSLTPPLQKPED